MRLGQTVRRKAGVCAFLATTLLMSLQSQSQDLETGVVTLLPLDRAAIGTQVMPRRDILSHLTSLHGDKSLAVITIRNCSDAPDAIHLVATELRTTRRFIMVLDKRPPRDEICSSYLSSLGP